MSYVPNNSIRAILLVISSERADYCVSCSHDVHEKSFIDAFYIFDENTPCKRNESIYIALQTNFGIENCLGEYSQKMFSGKTVLLVEVDSSLKS